jgi:phosphonate transport system substrate-binding protein
LSVGHSLEEIAEGKADISFVCGLLYVHMMNKPSCPIELLAAPVLKGERYQDMPIYFSDVIVRNDSSYTSFDDLQGCVWAYNEQASHSGYNLVCYSLLQRGKTPHYFGKTIATGSHLQSLQMVLQGEAHAAALDSHLLDVLFQERTELAAELRVIDSPGPSTIPPLVVASNLDTTLKQRVQTALLAMHRDPLAARELHKGLIDHFVPIADEHYKDIRHMFALVQSEFQA